MFVGIFFLQVERQDYQVKIANLQETRDVITHEMKDTWKQLQSMKDEVRLIPLHLYLFCLTLSPCYILIRIDTY